MCVISVCLLGLCVLGCVCVLSFYVFAKCMCVFFVCVLNVGALCECCEFVCLVCY